MSQKWLKATFPYLYKVELSSKIFGEGNASVKISDKDGNVVFSDESGARGHTIYRFYKDMTLNSKTTYDSYGYANTTGITNVLSDFIAPSTNERLGGEIIIIITADAITNDSDFSNILKSEWTGFNLGDDVTCTQTRNSFAFIGIKGHSGNLKTGYIFDSQFEYKVGASCSFSTYIIPTYETWDSPKTLSRVLNCYTKIYPANDSTQAIWNPYATLKAGNTIGLSNTTLYAGRTYYVKVRFRTRGDGNSTSSHCSSIGFNSWWNNWGSLRAYIHNSQTAYSEIGQIVEWTYSFTVDSDITPQGTNLYFIIDNGWANGLDDQTIDLYYCKYWDSDGNVYNEFGSSKEFVKITKDGESYYAVNMSSRSSMYVDWDKCKYALNKTGMRYSMLDSLDRLTYSEMEKLKNGGQLPKILNLDLLCLYKY